MAQVLDRDLGAFRTGFAGAVITPADPNYDSARSLWNGAIDRRPAVIARCSNAVEVAAAIKFGRDQGLEIAVRGGGHNFAGFGSCEAGLMIDLSAMRHVTVDPAARRAVAGGGATWGDVDGATQAHGLAVVGGFISHTGIGGLTLGGGMGWLTRKAGLSVDNLVAAEVVTADGRILRASATENPDLFWAIRGGGGNFGVVTSFEYRLHEVGPLVHLGLFFWGVDQGVEALRFSRDFVKTVPENAGLLIGGLNAPPAPFVPERLHHAPGYALLVVGFGSAEEHEQIVRPIREALPPLIDFVTPIPYAGLQQMFNDGNPWGILGYEKALYLDDLTDAAIDVFTEYLPKKSSPMSFVPIFVTDGAYGRVGDDETAFGGPRSCRFAFNIAAICPTPELFQADRAWVRSFWEALRPHANGSGSYVNFMAEYEENRVRASYGAAKYDRLARIKAEYDPDNVFHLNANIKPARQLVGAGILQNTRLQRPALTPELRLYLADELMPIWRKTEEELGEKGVPPPYWAFAWVGGLAIARYLLDHPDVVAGKRVIDLASGSGLCAIAAMKAGAARALAADVDQLSGAAVAENALANDVMVDFTDQDLLDAEPADADLILAGDVWYEKPLAARVLHSLQAAHRRGTGVLMGDLGRAYFPREGLIQLATYQVPTTRELEDAEVKAAGVYTFPSRVKRAGRSSIPIGS